MSGPPDKGADPGRSDEKTQHYSSAPTLDPTTAGKAEAQAGPASAGLSAKPVPFTIDRYKLLEVIGEGGFGTVWIADQTWPVKRRVALKIIKPGMDSKAVIARFEQERQALAIMDHPSIAKVYDAGTSPDGRPYFVMEYVPGEPITTYCDKNRLNIRQRLELYIPVCEAVQHAHHKGIIHRDIKPGNVLVTVTAGSGPTVKVIDFGVAKAVSHVLTDKTLFTEQGQILGTPEYMSPEQAEMGALDIDTRTDVYALGVLLYELLTGALPFEPHDLRSRGYNEIQRIIREVDPPKPSARLRSLGKVSAEIAKKRQARLEELEGQLRRELEWIPLKAMRKDRAERYATPVAMADDIRNHLAGRPLVAGPESPVYRAKKFITRNRVGVTAAALVVLALLIGAIVSTIGFVRAARNAEMYRREYERAEAESARQRAINFFTTSMLSSANPAMGDRKDVTVRELLEDAVVKLEAGQLAGQPGIEGAVRSTLARTFRSLSFWDAAELQWRKALELATSTAGSESADAADALAGLGQLQLDTARFAEARESLERALDIQRRTLGPDNWRIGDTINNLGLLAQANLDWREAESRYREALEIYQKHPGETERQADALSNLAGALYQMGDKRQAIEMAQRALEFRRQRAPRSIDVWNSLINLGTMLEGTDDLPSAERARRDALALARELFDENHRNTVISMQLLAKTLWQRGGSSLDEAQSLQTRALELAREVDGEKSLSVAQGTEVLGLIARDRGENDRAVELFRQDVALRKELQGPAHKETAVAMSHLADALARAGKSAEAIELAQQTLVLRKKLYEDQPGHWVMPVSNSVLGGAYLAAGEYSKAEPLLLDAFADLGAASPAPPGRRQQLDALDRIILLYDKWGKLEEMEKWKSRRTALSNPATQP